MTTPVTEAKKKPAEAVAPTAKVSVTFARKLYVKGDTIPCSADQKRILEQQGVI